MMVINAKFKGKIKLDTSSNLFIQSQQINGRDFSGLKMDAFDAVDSSFEQCNFRNMRVRQICLAAGPKPSHYCDCSFDGIRFDQIGVGQARFENCSFLDVRINRLFSHAGEFIDCTFSGVLKSSVFFGSVMGNHATVTSRRVNEFRGNDFSKMKFVDVGFRNGIDLTLQKLPVGTDYLFLKDAEGALTKLRSRYVQSQEYERREAVFVFLKGPEERVKEGQKLLFLCKSTYDELPYIDRIWNELRDIGQGIP